MCCFDLLNCYIYEASKKWRNRQMKREQVLALYDTYADSVYRVALGYLRSPHDARGWRRKDGVYGREPQRSGSVFKR